MSKADSFIVPVVHFSSSDIGWRDDMIRDLRKALKFYADTKNYHGFDGGVLVDNGKIARDALEKRT